MIYIYLSDSACEIRCLKSPATSRTNNEKYQSPHYWSVVRRIHPLVRLKASPWHHHNAVIISAMASQITSLTIVYLTVYSGADQRKHQSSASLDFVRRIHRWPVNSPHKSPVTRKMFPFDDIFMHDMAFLCQRDSRTIKWYTVTIHSSWHLQVLT